MDIETLAGIVKERLDDIKEEITELRTEVRAGFAGLDVEIQELREDVRDIKNRLNRMEDDIENTQGYAKEIDGILERLKILEQKVATAH